MSDLELLASAISLMKAAIRSGDWKVDGACDPDSLFWAAEGRLQTMGFTQNTIDDEWQRPI